MTYPDNFTKQVQQARRLSGQLNAGLEVHIDQAEPGEKIADILIALDCLRLIPGLLPDTDHFAYRRVCRWGPNQWDMMNIHGRSGVLIAWRPWLRRAGDIIGRWVGGRWVLADNAGSILLAMIRPKEWPTKEKAWW